MLISCATASLLSLVIYFSCLLNNFKKKNHLFWLSIISNAVYIRTQNLPDVFPHFSPRVFFFLKVLFLLYILDDECCCNPASGLIFSKSNPLCNSVLLDACQLSSLPRKQRRSSFKFVCVYFLSFFLLYYYLKWRVNNS